VCGSVYEEKLPVGKDTEYKLAMSLSCCMLFLCRVESPRTCDRLPFFRSWHRSDLMFLQKLLHFGLLIRSFQDWAATTILKPAVPPSW